MTKITYSHAREHFTTMLNRVAYGEGKYLIERRGRPLAALVPIQYLTLLERVAQEFAKIKVPKR